jgi:hypothetical protein
VSARRRWEAACRHNRFRRLRRKRRRRRSNETPCHSRKRRTKWKETMREGGRGGGQKRLTKRTACNKSTNLVLPDLWRRCGKGL